MYIIPEIEREKFDLKGKFALQNLNDLQQRVLMSDEHKLYKPSQSDISKIQSIVFKARVKNQHQLNEWFLQSIIHLVQENKSQFLSKHLDISLDNQLVKNYLQVLRIIIRSIYYSGVFIMDAKDSRGLFTQGVNQMRQDFFDQIQPKIVEQIMLLTRTLDLNHTQEQLDNTLQDSKTILQIIQACGYKELTIIPKKDTMIISPKDTDITVNKYYEQNFELKYTKMLKNIFVTLPHESPLQYLKKQIQHEYNLLQYLSPTSERKIMDTVVGDIIWKIVKVFKKYLPEMIENNQYSKVLEYVELFKIVVKAQNLDKEDRIFELGTQYVNLEDLKKLPLRPFKLLAKVFRKYLIQHSPPKNLVQLIGFIKKYDSYFDRIFEWNSDIIYGYLSALEVIINDKMNIQDELIQELSNEEQPNVSIVLKIIKLLNKPTFITKYSRTLIQKYFSLINLLKMSKVIDWELEKSRIQALRDLFPGETNMNNHKLGQLFSLVESLQLKIGDLEGVLSLKIPEFCLLQSDYIQISHLPKSLQERFSEQKRILINYGYSIIKVMGIRALMSNAQMILVVMLEQSEIFMDINQIDVRLRSQIQGLIQVGLVKLEGEQVKLNDEWGQLRSKKMVVLLGK